MIGYIHPVLETLDYRSTAVKVKIILVSYFGLLAIYVLSHITASLTWTYKNLRTKEKVFWNLAIVRAVFGVFCTCIGVWAMWFDEELRKDIVFATTPTSSFALCVTVGFFAFECTATLLCGTLFQSAGILLNLHHWLALISYSLSIIYESAHFFGTLTLFLEMSTPFSALCWILLKCGQQKTLLWKVNQYILVHTFHCRSLVEGYMFIISYKNLGYTWSSMPTPIFLSLYLELPLLFFIMTPYWTYKKTHQMINPVDWNFEDSHTAVNGSVKKGI